MGSLRHRHGVGSPAFLLLLTLDVFPQRRVDPRLMALAAAPEPRQQISV
jgi:hypothetical protein